MLLENLPPRTVAPSPLNVRVDNCRPKYLPRQIIAPPPRRTIVPSLMLQHRTCKLNLMKDCERFGIFIKCVSVIHVFLDATY